MADHSHKKLQEIAISWLKRPQSGKGPGCQVALQEVGGLYGGERADAWGYRWGWGGGSIVVEVKVSRSDFLVDAKKPHRNGEVLGMGTWRYYMCPEGIINLDDLPHGWGLLWVNSRGHVKLMAGHVCCLVDHFHNHPLIWCWSHQVNEQLERDMMAHLLNRVGDPEAMNQQIRFASGEVSRLMKRVNELQEDAKKNSLRAMGKWVAEQNAAEAIDMLKAAANGGEVDSEALDRLLTYRESLAEAEARPTPRRLMRQ